MALPVAISLREFPKHAEIIGDMLLGYSDLEFFMVDLVGQALGEDDLNTAARILYRLWGADARLQVADAIVRPFMTDIKLLGPYCQWLGAMRQCRKIRNQYAHCGWSKDAKGRLEIANLEAAGATIEGSASLEFLPLELGLLKQQQAFFGYTIDVTLYVMAEARFREDRRRKHRYRLPKSRALPKLHSPLD